MSKPIIEVENLGKCYRIGANKEPYLSLRDEVAKFISRFLPGNKDNAPSEQDFWALNDVSFSVQEGEAVGIIGRNGAGKSTLLKILSQITPPTKGKITMRGRVASLLEVGTGFHPELTGRENIFLNGAILGMSRGEIRRKFDEIVSFAEVEKFLDTPVKRYSSGMYVRLAFAVAAHLEPEILVVDEVLAVGDAEFQRKCLGKMSEVAKCGRTVLFVSHNMSAIKNLCPKAILLDKGEVSIIGDSELCINTYLESSTKRKGTILSHGQQKNIKIKINKITVNNFTEDCIDLPGTDQQLQIRVSGSVSENMKINVEAELEGSDGLPIGTFKPWHYDNETLYIIPGVFDIVAKIELPRLLRGHYFLSIYITNPTIEGYWDFVNSVEIIAEGWPLTTFGSALHKNNKTGAIILTGNTKICSNH